MRTGVQMSVAALLVGMVGLQTARADIYTWTDKSGTVNISNLQPPDGVRVTNVLRESAPRIAPSADNSAELARQAEVRVLADRVRQLEQQVEIARYQPPPPVVDYPAVAAPPVAQYGYDPTPPGNYGYDPTPPGAYGCDSGWGDCTTWWPSAIYPGSVIVVGTPNFRRYPPPYRRGYPPAMHGPPYGGQGPAPGMHGPPRVMHGPPPVMHAPQIAMHAPMPTSVVAGRR